MRRILAIKLADLGDLLSITPALRALRLGVPDATISALVTPSSASLLQGSDLVDEVIPFNKFAFDQKLHAYRGLPQAVELARGLRGRKFDDLLLFHHLATTWGRAKYAALTLASGASVRAGLDNGHGWFLNRRVTDRGFGALHEVDYWLEVAALVGGHNPDPRPELPLRDEHFNWADEEWRRLGLTPGETVVIHPGSGAFSLARRWPVERFVEVAVALRDDPGLSIAVLAGPAPGEAELAETVRAAMPEATVIKSVPSPLHLAALLRPSALVLGNDSGVIHLASAVGCRIVAVFGPTNDRAWGPYPAEAPRHAVVAEALACRPCVHRGFSYGTPQGCPARTCLQIIETAQVLAAARNVLDADAPSFTIAG